MRKKFETAHAHSANHRSAIESSDRCGCFSCKKTFPSEEIGEWADSDGELGQTALCPRCGIDAVIGDSAGYELTAAFLAAMHRRWFS